MDNVSGSNNENVLFRYILENPVYYKYMDKSFFRNKDLSELMSIVRRFYDKYSEVPSAVQVAALIRETDVDMEESFVRTVYNIELEKYDTKWIKETTEAWIKWKNLQKNLVNAFEIAKLSDVNAGNVASVVNDIVSTIDSSNTVNFDFKCGLDFFDADSHRQDVTSRISSGYKHVDERTGGGYDPKTLISYVGASNIGKCVCGDTAINIKNSRTGEVFKTTIGEFYEMLNRKIKKWEEST
jgi:hypothetical protein